ncbi:hypothetical protein GLOTRDRAFT_34862, partial [Gloeophyllum trabeum ATCC 11539]
LPEVASTNDFELSRALKEKGRLTGKYEPLNENAAIKGLLMNWDTLAVQYKDPETGNLLPIEIRVPSQYDDEEEPSASATQKGKRKAPPA